MTGIFIKILRMSAWGIGLQMFLPVITSGVIYLAGYPLTAFLVFQLFIEAFALWQLSMGIVLSKYSAAGKIRVLFIFNMIFALAYRFGSNAFQVWHYVNLGGFAEMEKLYWLIPVHIYASAGMIYCFWLNAKWIRENETADGTGINESVLKTFFRVLMFPWGLWNIQPRLNAIVSKYNRN